MKEYDVILKCTMAAFPDANSIKADTGEEWLCIKRALAQLKPGDPCGPNGELVAVPRKIEANDVLSLTSNVSLRLGFAGLYNAFITGIIKGTRSDDHG